jgi:hypothetical protein
MYFIKRNIIFYFVNVFNLNTGTKTQPKITRINNAESSKPAVPIPVEEPDPESPIK